MKTAIYIEDGTVQLVITPETEFEKNAIASFSEKPLEAKVFAGSFYDCRGGWVRQSQHHQDFFPERSDLGSANEKSLILRMSEPKGESQ